MFVFKDKNYLGGGIQYKWSIDYNDNTIGTMHLILVPKEVGYELHYSVSAIAYFYREKMRNITEYDINQIEKDFISLANNRLLDVDEDYSNLYVVENRFDDTIFFNSYFDSLYKIIER